MNDRLVLFDLDGTLIDSDRINTLGFYEALDLGRLDGGAHDLDYYLDKYRGIELRVIFDDVARQYDLDLDFDAIFNKTRQRIHDLIRSDLRVFDGVDAAMAALPCARAVVSNAGRPKVELALEVTGLRRHFGDNLFSAYEIQKWKPEPDLYLHAAKRLGFAPDNCVVVEDSDVGITAGQSAGMRVLVHDPEARYANHGFERFAHYDDFLTLLG